MSEIANLNKIADLEGKVIVLRGLLGQVAKLVDLVAHELGECEDCDLMREVMEELGDD